MIKEVILTDGERQKMGAEYIYDVFVKSVGEEGYGWGDQIWKCVHVLVFQEWH